MSNPPPETGSAKPAGVDLVKAFINTAELEENTDHLATTRQARDWLQDMGFMGAEPLSDSERLRLVEVREALRALIGTKHGGHIGPESLAVLDGAGRTARLTLAFSSEGSANLHPDATGIDRALGEIIGAVYTAMIDGSWSRLKTCENRECRWAFHDQSKNHSAKWCSMQSCGNRMKARAYRARQDASN
jgi:predicted RNA-binding Zn ribbon-like protein